jgi:hypothetical protein
MDARGIDVVELLASDRIRALPARVERPFCFAAIPDFRSQPERTLKNRSQKYAFAPSFQSRRETPQEACLQLISRTE